MADTTNRGLGSDMDNPSKDDTRRDSDTSMGGDRINDQNQKGGQSSNNLQDDNLVPTDDDLEQGI